MYDPATNRSGVNGATWDAAGRQQSIGGYGFAYDAENRMASATLNIRTVYQYDGDGRRVAKINCPGTATCDATTTGASTVWYVYDAAGNLATEYGQSSMASALPCTTCYLIPDHLGSTRVMTDQDGNAVTRGCHDYLPFGGEIYSGVGGRTAPCYPAGFEPGMLFTGKLRDAWGESGLDYFGARYFSAAQGRFTSPDEPLVFANPENPQTWNLYSYARNNPLKNVDPTGHDDVAAVGCGEDAECLKKLAAERGKSAELLSGAAKSVVNTFIDLSNKVNNVIDLALGAAGSTFQFGQTDLLPMTPTEQAGGLLAAGVTLAATAGESLLTVAESGTATAAQTFQRVLSTAELDATQASGLLRGGRAGENFFTNAASLDAKRAQIRLGLSGPLRDSRVTFTISGDVPVFGPFPAKPGLTGTPGGGIEFFTRQKTPITIIRIDRLRR